MTQARSIGRRAVLMGGVAAVAGLAGCAKQTTPLTRPTVSPLGAVSHQLTEIAQTYAQNTDKLGIAVRDLRTGKAWDFKGDYASQSASMAKVMIAAMALRQAREQGHELDFDHQTQLSTMLINSDNDSADALWAYAGGPDAYQALARELGMGQTKRDAKRPDWSWTWTTPKDQLILLDRLTHGTSALIEADRLYLFEVMGKTNSKQTWGVGHDKGSDVEVHMKNGWVQFGTGDFPGLWAVNSMGHVSGEGREYTAAMMCRMPTFEAGRDLLDAIGADLFKVLAQPL